MSIDYKLRDESIDRALTLMSEKDDSFNKDSFVS